MGRGYETILKCCFYIIEKSLTVKGYKIFQHFLAGIEIFRRFTEKSKFYGVEPNDQSKHDISVFVIHTQKRTTCNKSANKLLQVCSQAVNKMSSHCLFPVVETSL